MVVWLKSAFCVTLGFFLLHNVELVASVELQEEMRSYKAGSWKAQCSWLSKHWAFLGDILPETWPQALS